MSKLILIEKDYKTNKIIINSTPLANSYYKIIFTGRADDLAQCIVDENTNGAKAFFDNNKNGRTTWNIQLAKTNNNLQYSVVLNNTNWLKKNINYIISQLINQEQQMLIDIAIKKQVKNIAEAVKSGNYTSLIQQMIIDNAHNLTDMNIMEIQSTLTDIKQERGLVSNLSSKFGL